MFKEDQFWRIEYLKANKNEKSKYDERTIEKRWKTTGSMNMIKAKEIVNKYGYPGYNLTGETSDNFWAIVQHCDDDMPFQEHVLSLMKKQIDTNNASKEKYAYLFDRVLVNQNKKQIYGTQLTRDPKTGKFSPFPLKTPKWLISCARKWGWNQLKNI